MKLTLSILVYVLISSCTQEQRDSLSPIKVFVEGESGNTYGYSTDEGVEIEIAK